MISGFRWKSAWCLALAYASAALAGTDSMPVRVGIFQNPPIVSYPESGGPPQGIAIDVLREVAEREHWRLEYVPGTWETQLRHLDAGDIDLVVGIAHTPERAQRYRFTRESLLGNWGIVFGTTRANIHSLIDLKGRRVALMQGSVHSQAFENLLGQFGLSFVPVYRDSYPAVFDALARADADAGVVNRTFAALHPHQSGVQETGIVFNPVNVHYAAPKNANPVVVDALDRNLAVLKANPDSPYYRSLRRWLEAGAADRGSTLALWVAGSLAVLLLVAVLAALWWRREVRHHAGALRSEIQRRQLAQGKLHFITHYDSLTQLPNRQGMQDLLVRAIETARQGEQRFALLFIDVDRLKNVNDGLGHAAGDALLQHIAGRLQSSLRGHDQLCRFGGDEFMVIATHIVDPADAEQVAIRLLQTLGSPVPIGDLPVYVTASIGIAFYPDDAATVDELLQHADTAMYQAKEQGGNRHVFYHAGQTARVVERLTVDTRLRRALERGEMQLHYQPIVRMHDQHIVGVEALVRWQDPERGIVMPGSFIPVAEETGLILPLGEWVLHEACAQMKAWHDRGHRHLRLAVNVSTRQIESRLLLAGVEAALAHSGLAPEALELEITEGVLLVINDEMRAALGTLREMGVRLTIDDFGTGYSSLSFLKQLPFHHLKIDRTFVANIPDHPSDTQIATTILLMAHGLGLQVVAEGIETAQQNLFLKDRACEFGQGYLFGRPQPPGQILELLAATG